MLEEKNLREQKIENRKPFFVCNKRRTIFLSSIGKQRPKLYYNLNFDKVCSHYTSLDFVFYQQTISIYYVPGKTLST